MLIVSPCACVRITAAASSREGMESADTDGLIRSDDSIQTDGAAAVSPKEKSKRTRHRPSAKK